MSLHGMKPGCLESATCRRGLVLRDRRPGFKYNLTDVAAAIGLPQLKRCDEFPPAADRDRAEYQLRSLRSPRGRDSRRIGRRFSTRGHLYVIQVEAAELTISRDASSRSWGPAISASRSTLSRSTSSPTTGTRTATRRTTSRDFRGVPSDHLAPAVRQDVRQRRPGRDRRRPRRRGAASPMKRAFDIAASAAGLILVAPLLVATALLLQADGGGTVLFAGADRAAIPPVHDLQITDVVVGRGDDGTGHHVRTGPARDRPGSGPPQDQDVTSCPSYSNVLRGDMSLVGPGRAAADVNLFRAEFAEVLTVRQA